jgi:hypothetical protein
MLNWHYGGKGTGVKGMNEVLNEYYIWDFSLGVTVSDVMQLACDFKVVISFMLLKFPPPL